MCQQDASDSAPAPTRVRRHRPHVRRSVRGTFSLNAAMLAAALLASRLPTAAHVFALLSLAAQLFALLPIARDALRARSEPAFLAFAGVGAVLTLALCAQVGAPRAAGAYVLAVAAVTLACPAAFIALQPLKHEITGPWDVRKAALTTSQLHRRGRED